MSDTQPEEYQEPKKTTEPVEPTAPKKRRKRTVKKQTDVIPNMELALIGMFFLSFIIWSVSKCTVTRKKYEQEAGLVEAVKKPKNDSIAIANKEAIAAAKKEKALPKKKTKTVIKEITVLYVVLNKLKLRNGPTRDSSIVYEFKANDRITFLGQVTDFKEKINLGNRVAEEPWVKVRARSGHEGWVYGAGVSYYKQAVVEPTVSEREIAPREQE